MAAKARALPEVRQQQNPDADQYGSSAIKAAANRWLVASPEHGGHWGTDAEVKDWKVLA